MTRFAEVGFKGSRRDYYGYENIELAPGDPVIVEAERGEDFGRITALGAVARRKCSATAKCGTGAPSKRVIRRAFEDEVRRARFKADDERWARREVRKRVARRKMKMKVADAEWQFDRKKIVVYFTARRRVDFRALVRELATAFRAQVELRQIGVREEAAMLGGVGRCGRELCSSTWLPELKPVSLQVAKDQGLSLNPSQISGCCGRLMCCLKYEHDHYLEARRRFPREGRRLGTRRGTERVVGVDVFNDAISLEDASGQRRVVDVETLKAEVRAASAARRSSS